MSILIGTSGWSFDDWRGDFYPAKLPKNEWLQYYATQFSVVELNATTYRYFKPETYEKWFNSVPDDFRFIVKMPRLITHFKKLKKCAELINDFEESSSYLKNKRALFLLQLPPTFPYDPELLKNALLAFKDPTKVVVEFRNKQWHTQEVKELLTNFNCIFCSTDSPIMRLEDWRTSDIAYIRLHGTKQWFDYNYTLKQLKSIALFIKKIEKRGAKEIYVFFNNDYYANAPDNAQVLKNLLSIDQCK